MSIAKIKRELRRMQWRMLRGGPGRRARVLTASTLNGRLSFSNMDITIARKLFFERAWEFDLITRTMAWLREQGELGPESGDVMLDIGANVGMICIAMLKHGYFREALAFEPAVDNYSLLERNIRQNRMAGAIRPYHCGLSDVAGERLMELSDWNFGDHRIRVSAPALPGQQGEERRRTVKVPVRTLDDVLAEPGAVSPQRIGLLWVDIQGHEGSFFKGARRTLAHGMPVISEFWPYGLRRAGFDRESFTVLAASIFTHVVHVDPKVDRWQRQPIGAIADLFEPYAGPDDNQEVILLNQARSGGART
jgi:FkbM family methyltransferase